MSRRTGKPSYALPQRGVQRRSGARGVVVTVVVASLAALAGGAVGYAVGRPGTQADTVAELRRAEAERDLAQITELTTTARTTSREVSPVLAEFSSVLPADTASAPGATQTQLARWQETLRQAVERHAPTPSGMTGTNVARGGFRSAVDALMLAVDTYVASQQPLPAEQQRALMELADRQWRTGAAMWSVAATQLDQLNLDAGNGHQHVYLTGVTGEGIIAPDEIPEGTGG